jgi:hypothetical protein
VPAAVTLFPLGFTHTVPSFPSAPEVTVRPFCEATDPIVTVLSVSVSASAPVADVCAAIPVPVPICSSVFWETSAVGKPLCWTVRGCRLGRARSALAMAERVLV